MIRVVVDTNVIVSAHLSGQGFESRVLRLLQAGHLQWLVSEAVLTEYQGVLLRPRFHLDPDYVARFIAQVREQAIVVSPTATVSVSPDEADNRLLECAQAGEAHFLITGNLKHFPETWHNTRVVNARTFIAEITGAPLPEPD